MSPTGLTKVCTDLVCGVETEGVISITGRRVTRMVALGPLRSV